MRPLRPADHRTLPSSRQPTDAAAAKRAGAEVRVGAVQYLNTKPLVHGLATAASASSPQASRLTLSYDLPSRLADRLTAGSLDVALIPIVEVFRGGWRVITDVCIGCRGPVMSVKLFFRTAPQRVRRLALDEGSRTSAALSQVLLYERFGIRPEVEPLPIGSGPEATDADAVLLIGDRAIGPHGGPADRARQTAGSPGSFQLVWDLGDEWCRWTGLPFVFAAWAARPGVSTATLEPQLTAARDRGVANLAAIAAAEAPRHGLTVPQCLSYLHDNLHYHIGPAEQEAMQRFRQLTGSLGLLGTSKPQSHSPASHSPASHRPHSAQLPHNTRTTASPLNEE
jgi:chorismate dehydratase